MGQIWSWWSFTSTTQDRDILDVRDRIRVYNFSDYVSECEGTSEQNTNPRTGVNRFLAHVLINHTEMTHFLFVIFTQTPLFLGKEGKRTLFWSVRLPNAGCLSLHRPSSTYKTNLSFFSRGVSNFVDLITAWRQLESTSRPLVACLARQRCCCCLAYLS